MAGRACTVTSASHTLAASMAPVTSPGSASVRPTGVASSATKVHSQGTGPGREAGWWWHSRTEGVGQLYSGFYFDLFLFVEAFHSESLRICL